MQPYQRTREKREKTANVTGVFVTLGVHALALVVLLTSGLKYLDPPPPERTSLLIEFEEPEEMEVKPLESRTGRQPQAEEVDPEREVELVQKAESPHVSDRPNVTPETQPDAHGDVDACGLWVRHADRVKLENIRITPRTMNTRETVKFYDVNE